MATELLARLWKRQAELGLSNAALASEIGVTQSYVSLLRRGLRGRKLGADVYLRVLRRFPDLDLSLPAVIDLRAGVQPRRQRQGIEKRGRKTG